MCALGFIGKNGPSKRTRMHIQTRRQCGKVAVSFLGILGRSNRGTTLVQWKLLTSMLLFAAVSLSAACSREIRTVDDVVRAAGRTFEKADYWQTNVSMRLTRPTHISEWEGVVYSDGDRFAAIVNGASAAGELQSRLVVDGSGEGWLRISTPGNHRVLNFAADPLLKETAGPEAFELPGNPSTGNPLGMFLDPARALRILDAAYDLHLTRRTSVGGDLAVGFSGPIKPEALSVIDPEGYLAAHDLPIDNVDVTVRLYDGAPRRVQFMDNGVGYLLIDYSEIVTDPAQVDSRFDFDPQGADPFEVDSTVTRVAGVDDFHVLFAWDETRRVQPRMD